MEVNRKLDAAAMVALVSIFFGWFLIDTLAVTLGSLRHGVRFYDFSAVIADPTRMFFGTQTTVPTYLFGALCVLCLLLPFCVYLRRERWLWFAHAAPLLLMVICALVLYSRTSGELLASSADSSGVSANLVRLANGLVHRGSGMVAKHVAVSSGGYAAFLGCVVLALSGVRGYRRQGLNAA
jgi:hypothetical protein